MIDVAQIVANSASSPSSAAVVDTVAIVAGAFIIAASGWLVKAVKKAVTDVHEVKVILIGRTATQFEPYPPEGMIKTVADHGRWLKALMNASKASIVDNDAVQGPSSREAVRQLDQETKDQP